MRARKSSGKSLVVSNRADARVAFKTKKRSAQRQIAKVASAAKSIKQQHAYKTEIVDGEEFVVVVDKASSRPVMKFHRDQLLGFSRPRTMDLKPLDGSVSVKKIFDAIE